MQSAFKTHQYIIYFCVYDIEVCKKLFYSLSKNTYFPLIKTKQKYTTYTNNKRKYTLHVMITNHRSYHPKLLPIRSKINTLYCLWNIQLLDNDCLWIVWPRYNSPYCDALVQWLLKVCSWFNITTISWLAPWTDSLAHNYSIDWNIPTIAVIGWWFWWIFDSTQRDLAYKILDRWWLLLSEYWREEWCASYTFPARNRIIAWLSTILYIPEATSKSWSLITADFAYKMNIPIYCSPHSIFEKQSEWTNNLMEKGRATLIINFSTMCKQHFTKKNYISTENIDIPKEQKDVLSLISQWYNEQYILSKLNLSTWSYLAIISILEISWLIKQSQKWIYIIY